MTNNNSIFNDKKVSSIHISYLNKQKMYKIDYVTSNDFASTDIVKSYNAIIASIMLHSNILFIQYPHLTQLNELTSFFNNIEKWIESIDVPSESNAAEPSPSNRVLTKIPKPDWAIE